MATIAPPATAATLDLAALRAACTGPVVGPSDADYDAVRMPWSIATDQRPDVVVTPADVDDVARALGAARAAGLRVAVQGTGHAAHQRPDLAGTMLLRTNALTGVEIYPVAHIARVGAAALWQDVVPAAARHGLMPLAGSSPDVGVVGYTLGGGIGYLARRHGLACNHVTAIELVTLDGDFVRATPEHEAELFWALRGGSGRFGVVTAMEFRLEPVAELFAGAMFWPWERAAEVLEAWRRLTVDAPPELTSMARLLQLPPFPEVPEPLRGRAWVNVQLAYLGGEAAGAELVRELRALEPELDLVGPMPLEGLLRLHGDPEGPTPSFTDHALLDRLPTDALHALLEVAGPDTGSPLVNVELRHLGGALAQAPDGAGALATLDAAYALHTVGIPVTPEVGEAVKARNVALLAALAPYGSGRAYLNFSDGAVRTGDAFGAESARRLDAVRERMDPEGVLRTGFADAVWTT